MLSKHEMYVEKCNVKPLSLKIRVVIENQSVVFVVEMARGPLDQSPHLDFHQNVNGTK